jgi:hypothetical protein
MIFVFDRKVGVGSTPSIQMYSAWYAILIPLNPEFAMLTNS